MSYQTAYLKANYPVEFLAASMALDAGSTEKLAVFRQECQQKEIAILPPDLNASGASFDVEPVDDKGGLAIRYALGAVKNVGADAMSRLAEMRHADGHFTSLLDFLKRIPREVSNRRQMENLVRAGAFDRLHHNRRELLLNMDMLLAHADSLRREAESSQDNLFGGVDAASGEVRLQPCDDWAAMDRLKEEFEALGLYLSAHPLDSYVNQLSRLRVISSAELSSMIEARRVQPRVNLAGSVTAKQVRVSQRGNKFAFVQFTDQTGVLELTFFSDILAESMEMLESDKPLLVAANLKLEENGPRLLVARVQLLDDAIAAWHGGVGIWCRTRNHWSR